MDFRLDDEQNLVVSTIRRFADKELRGWSGDADRSANAPDALFDLGAELGFFVDAVPSAHDGLLDGEYSHLLRALRGMELGRGCAGMAALLESNVEPALAASKWGGEEIQSKLFEGFGRQALAALCNDFEGRLAVQGSTITGSLPLVPGASRADTMLLACGLGDNQIVALVHREQAKVEAKTLSGWRAGAWATWSFDKAALADDQILARGAQATAIRDEILAWARVNLAARAVGVATGAMEHARRYGEERVQFGQAIGTFESIVRMRDENETAIRAARLVTLEAAYLLDRGDNNAFDAASRARDLAAATVSRATIDAVQIYGGYGFVNDYPVEKLMRDARAFDVVLGNEAFSRVLARKSANA